MRYALAILVAFIAIVTIAAAAPAGTAVSLIGNNNATFSATTGESIAWFEYGMSDTTLNVWTPNQTAGGAYTWTEIGSPLTSSTSYYVAGCDNTGCDTPVPFTMGAATPLPTTTFGLMITNATKNKFNLLMMAGNIMLPYAWLFPANAYGLAISIVAALVLFALYYGLAVRTRGVAIPVIMGVIGAPYLLYANQGMNLGIPVEFQAVAQGIFYASLAGVIMVILKK
jgi:hypothetical protein